MVRICNPCSRMLLKCVTAPRHLGALRATMLPTTVRPSLFPSPTHQDQNAWNTSTLPGSALSRTENPMDELLHFRTQNEALDSVPQAFNRLVRFLRAGKSFASPGHRGPPGDSGEIRVSTVSKRKRQRVQKPCGSSGDSRYTSFVGPCQSKGEGAEAKRQRDRQKHENTSTKSKFDELMWLEGAVRFHPDNNNPLRSRRRNASTPIADASTRAWSAKKQTSLTQVVSAFIPERLRFLNTADLRLPVL